MNCTLTVGELYGCKLYLNEAVKSEKSKIRSEWFCVFKLKKKQKTYWIILLLIPYILK